MRNLMSARSALLVLPILTAILVACTTAVSPTPSPSPAVPSANATPAVTAPAADRFGYVFFTASFNENIPQRIVVRRERDATPVFELTGIAPVVSADGRRLAYWRTTPNVGEPRGVTTVPNDLRVLDVANPSSDRSVLMLPAESLGREVLWSNDGQGLLVTTRSREGVGPFGAPASYELLMLDLTTSPPSTRAAAPPLSLGFEYLPVAWDRPGQIAAAVITGEGGYTRDYVTWNGNATSPFVRTPFPQEPGAATGASLIAGWVQASDDAKFVMALEASRNVLRVWPILDPTKAEYVRRPSQFAAVWQPGPTAPYRVFIGENQKIDLVTYPTATATTLYTTTGTAGIAAVRPDGSGMLLTAFTFPPPGATMPPPPPSNTATPLVFVDVATRQATDVASPLTLGVRLHGRGVLLR